MAWTKEDYENLKRAMATGRRVVSYADRRVEYRSLAEMEQIKSDMEDELFPGKKRGRVYMSTSTGVRT